MSWLIVGALAGVLLVMGAHFYGPRKTYSNSAKDSAIPLVGGLMWLLVFAVIIRLAPAGNVFGKGMGVWLLIGFVAWIIYYARSGGDMSSTSLVHVPVTLQFWTCYVRTPAVARNHLPFEIEIALTERSVDISFQSGEDGESHEDMLQRFSVCGGNLDLLRFEEKAMITGGGLLPTSIVNVRVSGTAFRIDSPPQQVQIAALTLRPISFVMVPQVEGEHKVRVEFVDADGWVRGGMTVPVHVTRRPPRLLPDAVAWALTCTGVLVALSCVGALLIAKAIEVFRV